MKNKKETVCAIVVTYNRKKLLIECLESLQSQTRTLECIYIIDNASTDGTPELLKENGFIQQLPPQPLDKPWEVEHKKNGISISYVRMNENTGGAGGFYEGVKRGYEKGFDWLWLMDDDVEPINTALETMVSYKNISLSINPSKTYFNKEKFEWSWEIDSCKGIFKKIDEEFNNRKFMCVNL